jgi:AcrR family transcriptional regulator
VVRHQENADAAAGLPPVRRRNAAATRQDLLAAARRRFARDGYAATTVRDIAADASANVSLIHRYFASKEGLFEACLEEAGRSISQSNRTAGTVVDLGAVIAHDVTGVRPGAKPSDALLLLLRSSGDERAEQIRVGVLRSYSRRIAVLGGWAPDADDPDNLLLRAQVVLAAALGIVVLRTAAAMEPLASATGTDLAGPLSDLVEALLQHPSA